MVFARFISLLAAGLLVAPAAHADRAPAVRSADPLVLSALARGAARSSTFRTLLARLDVSDVIVHVERTTAASRARGVTRFVTATATARYLRITLFAARADNATIGLLGHELQHAAEVAEAHWVRTAGDYEKLYRDIGRAACAPPQWCFDTARAVAAGTRVVAELQTRSWSRVYVSAETGPDCR